MHKLLSTLALGLSACFVPAARADIYVVVNTANAQHALSQKEAVDLFMGRTRNFVNGDFALLFDLPRDSPVRASFYRVLTGMSPAQVNSYWARLMFAGQTMPPQALPNEAAMLDIVKRNPSAVGYLGQEPTDKGLRTVLILKETH